jgi:Replication protein/Transposase zinc-binding domain
VQRKASTLRTDHTTPRPPASLQGLGVAIDTQPTGRDHTHVTQILQPAISPIKAGCGGIPPVPPSSFVHTLETNSPVPTFPLPRHPGEFINRPSFGDPIYACAPVQELESVARHSRTAAWRLAAYHALEKIHEGERAMERFANCGSCAWLETTEARDDIRTVCNKCRHRWCPQCSSEKGALIARNITEQLQGRSVRFVTFTLRHSRTALRDQIDRLYRSFAALRRRAPWRAHVEGGAAFFEGKISERDGLWHPHLHVLVEGTFFDQRDIAREWHAVTGDSSIVDIRSLGNDGGAAKYIAKYVAKPAHEGVYSQPDKLQELMVALRGRRLCLAFGTWRGWQILKPKKDPRKWRAIAPLADLAQRAAAGEPEAARFLDAAARKWPELAKAYKWPQSGAP